MVLLLGFFLRPKEDALETTADMMQQRGDYCDSKFPYALKKGNNLVDEFTWL